MASSITTAEELLRARDVGRCELVRGRLVMMVPAGADHGRIAIGIGSRLFMFVEANGLGTVFAAETGFVLARQPDTVRAPDAAFVRSGRPVAPARGYYPGAPDLAVEVLSPDDRARDVRQKIAEWLGAGTRAVWVVDPGKRTVTVHEPGRTPTLVRDSETLRGGEVMPGFEVPVRDLFA
jgi:Uma2 family endonuclease